MTHVGKCELAYFSFDLKITSCMAHMISFLCKLCLFFLTVCVCYEGKFKSKVPDFFSCLKRRLLIKCYTSLETLFHTLFFDIIAVNFNALFQSFYPFCKTFGTFLCREVLEKFFHTILNFQIVQSAVQQGDF